MRVVTQGAEARHNPLWDGYLDAFPRVGEQLWLKNPDSDYTVEAVVWSFRSVPPYVIITVGAPR